MNLPLELVPIAGLLAIAWVINRSLLVVPAHEQVVVANDGEVVDLLEPGLALVRPFGQERTHYDMRQQTLRMGERLTTVDGEAVDLTVSLQFRVDDVRQLHGTVGGYRDRLADVVRRELRAVVGRENRSAVIDESDRLSAQLAEAIDGEVRSWGLDADGVELSEQTLVEGD